MVRNAMSKVLGWPSALDWSEAALKAAVGHATIRVRTLPQGGVVSSCPATVGLASIVAPPGTASHPVNVRLLC